MSPHLPIIKGKEVVSILKRAGFVERRITGSHSILKNPNNGKMAIVPLHGAKTIKRGTLFSIIRQAGLTTAEFEKLAKLC